MQDIMTEAYVTLVTNDDYVLGGLVLGHSIRKSGSTRQLVCLTSKSLGSEAR